jgi:hypothetical protein
VAAAALEGERDPHPITLVIGTVPGKRSGGSLSGGGGTMDA